MQLNFLDNLAVPPVTQSIAVAEGMLRFPTRYEDTDAGADSCGWVVPDARLNAAVRHAAGMARMEGGIRVVTVSGPPGSGKSTALAQVSRNVGDAVVVTPPHDVLDDRTLIAAYVRDTCSQAGQLPDRRLLVVVVDDYDAWLTRHRDDPKLFENALCMIDREAPLPIPTVFLWQTKDRDLQNRLMSSTTRIRRVAGAGGVSVQGPPREMWSQLIEASFARHNTDRSLAEFGLTPDRIAEVVGGCETLGSAMDAIKERVTRL